MQNLPLGNLNALEEWHQSRRLLFRQSAEKTIAARRDSALNGKAARPCRLKSAYWSPEFHSLTA